LSGIGETVLRGKVTSGVRHRPTKMVMKKGLTSGKKQKLDVKSGSVVVRRGVNPAQEWNEHFQATLTSQERYPDGGRILGVRSSTIMRRGFLSRDWREGQAGGEKIGEGCKPGRINRQK